MQTRELTAQDFVSLEALRGILALYVVFNHARGHLWAGFSALNPETAASFGFFENMACYLNLLTRQGHEAVIAFFVLSGFSIAHSLSRSCHMKSFFLRRFFRLYPPKVGALIWAAFVFLSLSYIYPQIFLPSTQGWSLAGSLDFLSPKSILSNLLYMPKGHLVVQFWSLPHEMLFYLIAPLLWRRPSWYLQGSAFLFIIYLACPLPANFLIEFAFHYSFFFAAGFTLHKNLWWFEHKFNSVHPWSRLCFAIGIPLLTIPIKLLGTHWSGLLAEVLAAAWAFGAVAHLVSNPVKNSGLRWLGAQSYSLYISHVATIVLVASIWHRFTERPLPEQNPFVWLICIPPAVAISQILFILTEWPSRRLIEKLRAKDRSDSLKESPLGKRCLGGFL